VVLIVLSEQVRQGPALRWGARPPDFRLRNPCPGAVDVLAHLTYGLASALINDELHAQPDRGPSSGSSLRRTRVG